MNNIVFLLKGYLQNAVPIINIAQYFNALNNNVKIICGYSSKEQADELLKKGIEVYSLNIQEKNVNNIFKILYKITYWIYFRYRANKMLKKESDVDFLYVSTADTAIVLRGLFEKKYKYFLHLRELHDANPYYMKLIRKSAQLAYKVIVPEGNRAYLYYNFLKLNQVPTVIPNKPFSHPRKKQMDINFLEPEIQQKIKSKKNIIYQGPLHSERNLSELLKVLKNNNEYNVILMGKDHGMLKKYKKINSNIIYISFISPPLHLNITSWAHIGIITYDDKSLNTIYCAPNKIWEFAGFGIPILSSPNLGVKNFITVNKIGVLANYSKVNEIKQAILNISQQYSLYSKNSYQLYDSIDVDNILRYIIN